MDFKNLTKSQQQYLALGAVAAAGLLYGLFVLIQTVVGIDQKSRAELQDLTEKIGTASQALHGEAALRQKIGGAGAELDEMFALMPEPGNEFIWATERVYELIRGSGLYLGAVDEVVVPSPRGGASRPMTGSYAVRISATGGYNELRDFLAKTEQGNPLVSVRNIEISGKGTASGQGHALRIELAWPVLLAEEGGRK